MRHRNWLSFRVDLDLFSLRGLKSTSVLWAGRKQPGLNLWVEFCLLLSWRSKMTWFLCAGQNCLVSRVNIDLLSFVRVVEIDLVFGSPKNQFVSDWASNLTSFSCGWPTLAWLHCGRSNSTWIRYRDRNWHGCSVGVKNGMVLVFGSKLTCL